MSAGMPSDRLEKYFLHTTCINIYEKSSEKVAFLEDIVYT